MEKRPLIGITMGDPSGIGPEIINKLFYDNSLLSICNPIIIGDIKAISKYADSSLSINKISAPGNAKFISGTMNVLKISELDKEDFIPGKPTRPGGIAMVKYILTAVDLCIEGKIDAMVTCPINKALMNKAGYNYQGHTQLISSLTDTDDYVMMLAGEKLRVTLVTIHCALKDVPKMINRENILKTISITASALQKDFGIKSPRIAVAALNPHAGEEGLFGKEEELFIRPAVENAIEEGWDVCGPLPADTLYSKAVSGEFDVIVNMYHDQGLIPLKLLHFSDAVNITLGLPIIRTSVDHGTAYDIAGKGIADHRSLKAAVIMAAGIAENRSRYSVK